MAIIYKIHYDNVGKAYIGSSLSEDPNYWGSMSKRGEPRMRDDHARAGMPIIARRREILWRGPADATLLSREYALSTEHRTNIPAYGYNLMPMLPGVNILLVFHWDTPPGSPIQKTTDCPYGMYTLHCHGEPEFWTTFTDLDGNTIDVYRGPYKSRAWTDYIAHKDEMVKLLGLDIPGDAQQRVARGRPRRPTTRTNAEAPAKATPKAPEAAAPKAPTYKKLRWQFAEGHDRSMRGTVPQYASVDGHAYAMTMDGKGGWKATHTHNGVEETLAGNCTIAAACWGCVNHNKARQRR